MRFIDLFAGIGGFRLALEDLGHLCVFSSEIDKNAAKYYKANFTELPVGDITKIAAKDIPQHDILCAGFPCQSFSIAGKQKGFLGSGGGLFFEIIRVAKHHKPKIIILENVPNIRVVDGGDVWKRIMRELEDLGYKVMHDILDAADFGPQRRRRIFIICLRGTSFKWPISSHKFMVIDDIKESTKPSHAHVIKNYTLTRPSPSKRVKNAVRIGFIGTYNGKRKFRKGMTVFAQLGLSPCLTASNQEVYSMQVGQGRRLYHSRGQAITLRSQGSDGSYAFNEPDLVVRRLTLLESKRIMGFPDSWECSKRTLGNAVCPPVVKALAAGIGA